jgi:hypothetical protein
VGVSAMIALGCAFVGRLCLDGFLALKARDERLQKEGYMRPVNFDLDLCGADP